VILSDFFRAKRVFLRFFKGRDGARSSLIEKEGSKKVYCEREGVREERGNGLFQEGPSWVFGGF